MRLPEYLVVSDFALGWNSSFEQSRQVTYTLTQMQVMWRQDTCGFPPTQGPASTVPSSPALKNTGQTRSVILFWQQHEVSHTDFIWQVKGVNTCSGSEVPPDNGYNMLAQAS